MAPAVSTNINIGLPQKANTPNASLLTVALLVVICGLFWFFIIMPKKSAVTAKQNQLNQLVVQQSQISSQLNQFNELVAKLQNSSQKIQQLDEALPLNGKTFDLQTLLQDLADSSGVTVGSINLAGNSGILAGDVSLLSNPYGANRTLKTIPGDIEVIGSFSQLLAFLQKIENSDRIMQVQSLVIANDKDNSLSMNITIEAYYFAP